MGYPWFRLYSETLRDRKLSYVAEQSHLPRALVLGVWTTLLCLANDSPRRGSLLLAEGVPIDGKMLCAETGLEEPVLISILDAFERVGMIGRADFVVTLSNWEARQFQSDYSTERVQRWRAEQVKHPCNVSCNGDCNTPDTEADTEQSGGDARATEKAAEKPSSVKGAKTPAAITAFFEEYKFVPAPSGSIWKEICGKVTDVPTWAEAIHAWHLAGNSSRNVSGMLDWYATGKRDNRQGHARDSPPTQAEMAAKKAANTQELRAQSKAWLEQEKARREALDAERAERDRAKPQSGN